MSNSFATTSAIAKVPPTKKLGKLAIKKRAAVKDKEVPPAAPSIKGKPMGPMTPGTVRARLPKRVRGNY